MAAAPEALVNQARWLRNDNLSLSAIAEATGLSRSTVGKYLAGEGEAIFTIVCEGCGQEAEKFRPFARFCSEECLRRTQAERYVPSSYQIACAECGIKVVMRRPHGRFCSRSCRNKARNRRRTML